MKIVVTGSSGTIGRPLCRELESRGHQVVRIDLAHGERTIRADIADYRQLEAAVPDDTDMVYHLAAEFGRNNGEDFYEQVWRTNAIGTKNILRLQEKLGFKLTFASSSEVYGERDLPMLSEDLPILPFTVSNDYAISKQVNEAQIQNAIKQHGSEIMTLRFFNAYGPGEYYHPYRSVVCLFCYSALHGLPYTVYEGYHRVFQYVDDLILTLGNAAERFHPGRIINVGGEEYCTVEDLHDEIVKHVPEAAHLATFLPEEKHNVLAKRPDISLAKGLLGHNPRIKLAYGVPATLEWMRQVYGR
jgi:dTDP-glucose 4,6-dehydratase